MRCLVTPDGASGSFGFSLAVADDTVIVGDPQANTVWVYRRNGDGFGKAHALRPPPGSDAEAYGKGFGHAVDIDAAGALVIGAFAEEAMGVAPRRNPGDGFRRLGEVFVADDPAGPVTRVPGLDALTGAEAFGFSVTRTGNDVALGLRGIAGDQYGTSSVLRVDLASGAHTRLNAPTPDASTDFGYALASAGRTLVIGAPWLGATGGGVIVDLETGAQAAVAPPQETPRTGFSVATDGTQAVFGGDATVIAEQADNAWAVAGIFAAVNGTVAIGGGRVGTLREASRARLGAVTEAPPLDITIIQTGAVLTERLSPPGGQANGRWPHRAIGMASDFGIVGRPDETGRCKVSIIRFSI